MKYTLSLLLGFAAGIIGFVFLFELAAVYFASMSMPINTRLVFMGSIISGAAFAIVATQFTRLRQKHKI